MRNRNLIKHLLIGVVSVLIVNGALASFIPDKKDKKSDKGKNPESTEQVYQGNSFEHLSLLDSDGKTKTLGKSALERVIVPNGETTRYKIIFDKSIGLSNIEIVGVGSTTKKDIESGCWIVTIKPEKTKYYRVKYTQDGKTTMGGFRVIVVDSNKYEEIINKIRGLKNYDELSSYYDELAGGSLNDFKNGKIK